MTFGLVAKQPAPWGPQRELRAFQGDRGWRLGQPGSLCGVSVKSRTALRARFVSADLEASQDRPPAITGVRTLRRDRACTNSPTTREPVPIRKRTDKRYSRC